MLTFKDIKKYILDNKLLTKEQIKEAGKEGKRKLALEELKKDGEV